MMDEHIEEKMYAAGRWSDAGCTAVRVDPSGVYTCTKGVIPHVQLYGLSDTVCTRVRME
jgi:hypothetical protein